MAFSLTEMIPNQETTNELYSGKKQHEKAL